MSPLEIVFLSIGLFISVIGFTRGHSKESSVTLIICAAIFLFIFLEDEILSFLVFLFGDYSETDRTNPNNLFFYVLFTLAFGSIVYASYAGNVLNLNPNTIPPPLGTFLTILIGLVNGYLVAGMLWYYLDKFEYPLQSIDLPLTQTGNILVSILPPYLFSSPFLWILPVVFVLLLKVAG